MYVAISNDPSQSPSTCGTAFLYNISQRTYTSINFCAPAGTKLTGSSVEWIVERPQDSNDNPYPLANYTVVPWYNTTASVKTATGYSAYEPGNHPSGVVYDFEMLDDSGSPISNCDDLGRGLWCTHLGFVIGGF